MGSSARIERSARSSDQTIEQPLGPPDASDPEAGESARTLMEPPPSPTESAQTIVSPTASTGAAAAALLGTPGRRIGPYEVKRLLGRGAMGTVLHAAHVELGREVALKVLATAAAADADSVERFRRESEAVARLDHPGIVRLYERGQADDLHYYAMELVEGTALDGIIRRERTPYVDAARIIAQCAHAMDFAHARGILHRDLKPANVLLDRGGRARITDFGLARMDQKATLTSEGTIVGTPLYLAPEVAHGERASRKSDIYSLGATLYELATGRPPYEGKDARTVMLRVINDPPIPPTDADPRVPKDLVRIIAKAMARNPEERYPNARAFALDLERFAQGRALEMQGGGGAAFRESAAVKAGKRFVTGVVVVGVVAGILGLIFYLNAKASKLEKENRELQKRAKTPKPATAGGVSAVDEEAVRHAKDRDVRARIALKALAEDARDGNAKRSFDELLTRAAEAERENSPGTRATVLRMALKLFPHRWDVHVDLARTIASSEPDEAELELTMAVLAPDAPRDVAMLARLERGRLYRLRSDALGAWLAAADLRVVHGAKVEPASVRAGVSGDLAAALVELGHASQAREVLEEAAEATGDDLARLSLGRAAVAKAAGQTATVEAELAKARDAASSDDVRRLVDAFSR